MQPEVPFFNDHRWNPVKNWQDKSIDKEGIFIYLAIDLQGHMIFYMTSKSDGYILDLSDQIETQLNVQ